MLYVSDYRTGIVTLTTDFGLSGSYVGAMRGAVLARNPQAVLVDITHQVGPQNLREGSRILVEAATRFPPGTVHVAVVDPGVGTDRAGLVIEAGGHFFVGPDNGLMVAAAETLGGVRAHRIENPDVMASQVSATFHGRDIFAPVAGSLSAGLDVGAVGTLFGLIKGAWIEGPVVDPAAEVGPGGVRGQVLSIDHFGNVVSNIQGSTCVQDGCTVHLAGRTMPFVRTYGDAAGAELVALVGSSGFVEAAVPNGSAAAVLGVGPGAPFEVRTP
ncbi:MAG: S-adenosylmethionine hydrolase [Myxococcota bacterium]|jgi:S-adenosylmethionine hydrolase